LVKVFCILNLWQDPTSSLDCNFLFLILVSKIGEPLVSYTI
jgi:hypothetical protein